MRPLIEGGTIDISQVQQLIDAKGTKSSSARKFLQMFKLAAATKHATGIINGILALAGQKVPIELPNMEIHPSEADADAVLAAGKLGFKVITTK